MEAAEPGRLSSAEAAAQRLRIDYAAAEVLRAFDVAGIRSIVLKGAPLVRWLYEPGEGRSYADCDLLVPPHQFDAASRVLTGLGFEAELDEREMPDWWREHGLEWRRASDRTAVDLHRTLAGARVDPDRVWHVLSQRTHPIDLAGYPARSLDTAGLALQLALHAAQHGGLTRQVDELELALQQAPLETWREAAALARELDAGAAFAEGLGFAPSGRALAETLDLPADASVEAHLRARGFAEPLTIEQFAQAGAAGRASMIRHKVFPPATYMRKWSTLAARGRAGLLLAYLWRPVWLLGRLPRAFRQWRGARRAAAGSGR
ncbi:MAG TPA: nucleotidyltransferase family protein [Thermoleophilaceae bacterium]|nr:nucleotidyltransferase family protein [Thermoleophilaceae bacterium]